MSNTTHITSGSISGALFRLGWPVTLSFFLYTSFVIIDSIWIGRLGSDALAASGPSQFASWSIFAIGEIIGIGATAIIARRIGAGEMRDAALTLIQGCWMVVLAGLLLAGGGAFFARTLYSHLGTSDIVNALGVRYLSILCYGAIFQFAGIFLESVLRSSGDTRTPLFVTAGGLALNAVLDPVLMFGWWGAPALGIAGAAIATVGSQALIVVVYLFYFRSGRATVPVLPRTEWKFDSYISRRIVQIGLPASAITFLFTIVYLFLTRFLAEFGTAPVAILGVGNRLEAITYLFGHGLSIATSTMVGQSLGAGKPDRAEKTAWYASAIASGFGLCVTALFLGAPEWTFSWFSSDPDVIAGGAVFLRILAICQVFMGMEVVLYGAFSGAGDTIPPTLISTSLNLARIPLAWFVGIDLGYGPLGIWWMISISCIVRGVLLSLWFRRNKWKDKVI